MNGSDPEFVAALTISRNRATVFGNKGLVNVSKCFFVETKSEDDEDLEKQAKWIFYCGQDAELNHRKKKRIEYVCLQ